MQANENGDKENQNFDDERSEYDPKTSNPKLPKFDGTHDPDLWLKQIDVSFTANKIYDDTQQANWMILALTGVAMTKRF